MHQNKPPHSDQHINDRDWLPLEEADWNFETVPDSEATVCCLWEYARESVSIGQAANSHWCNVRSLLRHEDYAKDPALKKKDDLTAAEIERRLALQGFDHEAFAGRFWKSEVAVLEVYQELINFAFEDARPWLCRPVPFRNWLNAKLHQSLTLRAAAHSSVGELEQLWLLNKAALEEARVGTRDPHDDSEDMALLEESEPWEVPRETAGWPGGEIAVALTVDFARFTDNEIVEEFRRWLRANRPARWKDPLRVFPDSRKQGRKRMEYRVALERLGLMRLLHWYPPEQLREELPDAWKKYGHKRADFRREVKGAARFFRKLFPFLPDDEKPRSIERHGVWLRKMNEIMAKAELEPQPG